MKIKDYRRATLNAGTVFRFPAQVPFESIVDWMLMEDSISDSGFSLFCVSGYHSGQVELRLPAEAKTETNRSIMTRWVCENWQQWIYTHAKVSDVWIREGYSAPEVLPDKNALEN
ncbi:Imm45 family immunity protein [Arthrobacter sp. MYb227]|uniref:Imm45 family immunity protein n=1 Tax=Arthrobacter sp. MYb227 TaxID=1848601 RepID=UPI0015E3E289|nr:Imm45 family immunity protein [Arthrobacter sp. MYb227]